MITSNPLTHYQLIAGYFVPDAIVAAVVGLVTGWCLGPCIPVVGKWLAKPRIIQVLLHGSVIAMALSSQFFPYSNDAPKRVVFQHTVQTIGTFGSTHVLLLTSYTFITSDIYLLLSDA